MNSEQTTYGTDDTKARSYSERSPEEIEQEIEGTRQRLSETLEALQHNLSPRERLMQARDSALEMGDRVMRSTREALTPDITTMIRMDHTLVRALFRRYRRASSMAR